MEIDSGTIYYRAIKDSFLWREGAILMLCGNEGTEGGYRPIEDIWDSTEYNGGEYISSRIIENQPEWFERVYPLKNDGKIMFATKEEAKEAYKNQFEPIKIK